MKIDIFPQPESEMGFADQILDKVLVPSCANCAVYEWKQVGDQIL